MDTASISKLDDFSSLLDLAIRSPRRLQNLFVSKILSTHDGFSVRAHVLCSDGNGRPDIGNLIKTLAASTLEYCIPRSKIIDAQAKKERDNSYQELLILHGEARKMFTHLEKSGEGGELLLFLLSETVLGYPQLVSKMSLKTSSSMHYHGLDGIFVSVNTAENKLRLHFGESKLHKTCAGSIRECIKSISPILQDQGGLSEGRRDFYLINTVPDLGDQNLTNAFVNFLDPSHEDYMSPEVCAVLLAGFNAKNYPAFKRDGVISDEAIRDLNINIKAIESSIGIDDLGPFFVDLFLLPFPCIDDFREKLRNELGLS